MKASVEKMKELLGGPTGVAKALGDGITSQAVSQWKDTVPVRRVMQLSKMTKIPPHELNDIFPAPSPKKEAAE